MRGFREGLNLVVLLGAALLTGRADAQDLMGAITNANLMTNFNSASAMVSETMTVASPSLRASRGELLSRAMNEGAPLTVRRGRSDALTEVHQELADVMVTDDAARARLLRALRSGEVASQFDAQLRYNRLDPGDLADALTAYVVIMWLIANDQLDGRSDPGRLKAVSDQLGPMFRSNPDLMALSQEQRAAEYERIAALSMYGIAAYTKFDQEGDRGAKLQLQAAVRESMQRAGWDLTAYDITHRGFEPRR